MFKKLCLLCFLVLPLLAACGRNRSEDPGSTLNTNITVNNDYPDDSHQNGEEYTPISDIPQHNDYIVALEVDPEARTVHGLSRITFTNRTGVPLETIVLRVFLNAFDPTIYPRPYPTDFEWRLYNPDTDRGHMTIEFVSVNNEELHYTLDGTILVIELEEPMEPDTTVQLRLQYSAYVPKLAASIGGNASAMWLGMFLPTIAAHMGDGWLTYAFYPVGSPFLMETANYQVYITAPIYYTVVGTGHRTEEIIYDTDIKITRFSATMTRDFAFAILSPLYNHVSITTESGVEINFHYNPESILMQRRVEDVLEFARYSMEHFEQVVGVYPFGQVTIVETDMLLDSVAFSQLIFADSRHLRHGDLADLAHSIGNQWFAGVVGTNRITEPWLDNGLTRFVQTTMLHNTPELLNEYMWQIHGSISHRTGLLLADGLWAYTEHEEFVAAQRYRAMLMLYQLMRRMGEENFWLLINRYYQTFSFRIATAADFISIAEEIYEDSLETFFTMWMFQDAVPPLR